MENLLTRIRREKENLPKRRRMLCNYILENPIEASALTIPELAARADIGTATVIRTIQALGYESVNRFKSDLRSTVFSQAPYSFSSYLNMNQDVAQQKSELTPLALYREYLASIDHPVFWGQLEQAAKYILEAKRVYVLGLRSSRAIAEILEGDLRNTGIATCQLGVRADLLYDHIVDMTDKDLLFAIASPPVTCQTIETIRACHRRGTPTVVMTHTASFPAAEFADLVISTESFGLPYPTVPLALAAEMLSSIVERQTAGSVPRAQKIEALLRENELSIWSTEE